jgi:hypothetical protein
MNNNNDIANGRSEAHDGDPSQRKWADGYDLIGVFGEELFAARYGLEINADTSKADPGWDFEIGVYKFDVKTSTHVPRQISPTYLKVEYGKCRDDVIYVLALYDKETKTGHLMGWEWGELVPQHSCEMTFITGVRNHAIAHDRLHGMGDLDRLIADERERLRMASE